LRDVTATVGSLPLIVSSILSKKVAGGADAIVLDVKAGSGALMKTVGKAKKLAEALVRLGTEVGREIVALVSEMSQPLGAAVGNSLEVKEAVEVLHGRGPVELRRHCAEMVAEMLLLAGSVATKEDGRQAASRAIKSASAWRKFRELVAAQGGDVSAVDHPDLLPAAPLREVVRAPQRGYLKSVAASEIGRAVVALGGGRRHKGDDINHSVGIIVHHRVGDLVQQGEPLFTVEAEDSAACVEAREQVLTAHRFTNSPVEPLPLFYARIDSLQLESQNGSEPTA
jgi:pyrimidine-nucleoside phosphorylase